MCKYAKPILLVFMFGGRIMPLNGSFTLKTNKNNKNRSVWDIISLAYVCLPFGYCWSKATKVAGCARLYSTNFSNKIWNSLSLVWVVSSGTTSSSCGLQSQKTSLENYEGFLLSLVLGVTACHFHGTWNVFFIWFGVGFILIPIRSFFTWKFCDFVCISCSHRFHLIFVVFFHFGVIFVSCSFHFSVHVFSISLSFHIMLSLFVAKMKNPRVFSGKMRLAMWL